MRQYNCWSLRYSWSIACQRCSNYILILELIPGFNRLGKNNDKTRWEFFFFFFWGGGDLVGLILEIWRYYSLLLRAMPWWHMQSTLTKAQSRKYIKNYTCITPIQVMYTCIGSFATYFNASWFPKSMISWLSSFSYTTQWTSDGCCRANISVSDNYIYIYIYNNIYSRIISNGIMIEIKSLMILAVHFIISQ